MPIKGVICGHDGKLRSFDECICGHQTRERSCHFPTFALKLMRDHDRKRGNAGYSATMLLACPRAIALLENFDYYEDLESGWNKLRGELLHAVAEAEPDIPEGIIKERRVRKTVLVEGEEIVITGQVDELDKPYQGVIDYKFTGSIPEKPKKDHVAQFNIYAWLCEGGVLMAVKDQYGNILAEEEPINIRIERGGMHYLTLKKKKKRDGTVILPWKKVSYPRWPNGKTEKFVIERLTPLVQFHRTGIYPACGAYDTGFWTCECAKIEKQLAERGISIEN